MVKFVWQISYPPANGASLGSYLVKNASSEIFKVKNLTDRQTDRQSHKMLTPVCVFFSSQNFLPPYSLRSQGDYLIVITYIYLVQTLDGILALFGRYRIS